MSWNSDDLLVGLAENPQAIARRFERDLGGAHVVLGAVEQGARLLHLLERDRFSLVEQALPLIDDLRQVEREWALFNAVEAAMKSFCACTMSVASTVNSGWPTRTISPGLTNSLVTRPA